MIGKGQISMNSIMESDFFFLPRVVAVSRLRAGTRATAEPARAAPVGVVAVTVARSESAAATTGRGRTGAGTAEARVIFSAVKPLDET